ncbi:MAG: bifunctional diaminohydroxyphosphoribosylaminopyrimidine deaminase/5-amino-6-(5-phosphoribosylamino)uracil reductase RibD [Cellvibrionales bacterium]|nr:bifunctional diaminohydroxyphosphoribosylaminopyrimidine deaminase/5-amino-6-(5-phosphoribosylamino)uracil reductase RibD [Cellvibrionales bacterium]
MPLDPADRPHMARAIELAERGLYSTRPNPRVGAVLVRNGKVIGEGWHRVAGGAHAEVEAIRAAGDLTRGATCYVSLEPCNHQGKTGACAAALIEAGVARVVYGQEDPNPQVSGRGLESLRRAAVAVDGPLLEPQARRLNPGFNKRMSTGLPFVRLKLAMSLDGRTADSSGNSFWITSSMARAHGQRLRARSCAVITGWKTVVQDKARLTLRPAEFGLQDENLDSRQPLRVLLDSRNSAPRDEPFFQADGPILVANIERDGQEGQTEHRHFAERDGRVCLAELLAELGARECNEVLVEAGAELSAAFLRMGLVDELQIYVAPKLMGSDARPLFDLPLKIMDAALPLRFVEMHPIGRDLRITAVPETE